MDFFELYSNYSNVQLLKIIKKQEEYQPEAVKTATEILKGRHITNREIEEVEEYYASLLLCEEKKLKKNNELKNKVLDIIGPVIKPQEEFKPANWLKLFLLVISIQYLWLFYKNISYFVKQFNFSYDIFFYVQLLSLLYYALILYLLFRKRKWGWILLFSDNLFVVISGFGRFYQFFHYKYLQEEFISTEFIFIYIIRIAFLLFLFRPAITDYFKVSRKSKILTLYIVGTGTILLITSLILLMD